MPGVAIADPALDPMSMPGIDCGWAAAGLDGEVMSIPGIGVVAGALAGRFGAGRAAFRVGCGFVRTVDGFAFAGGFLAGIGMVMLGMFCIDWASAGDAARTNAIADVAARATRRIMPSLRSAAR